MGYDICSMEMTQDAYPGNLLNMARPPLGIFYRGDIGILNENRSIAVVGSRHVSDRGIRSAYRTGYVLGRRGLNVVNGLALGCDTHAFHGALAAGGKCVAVMPCGLDGIVPRSNTVLAEKILSCGGCLISAYPVGTPVRRYQYVERDRLQSGISDAVIVIEAGHGSGTMYTAGYAMKQGKRLACMDGRLVDYSSGNRWLAEQAGVKVIHGMDDLERFIAETTDSMAYRQMRLLNEK